MTNGTENSVVLLTSTEKSGQPWLLLLLHYHENTTLIWKTYFGTAPTSAKTAERRQVDYTRNLQVISGHLLTPALARRAGPARSRRLRQPRRSARAGSAGPGRLPFRDLARLPPRFPIPSQPSRLPRESSSRILGLSPWE